MMDFCYSLTQRLLPAGLAGPGGGREEDCGCGHNKLDGDHSPSGSGCRCSTETLLVMMDYC